LLIAGELSLHRPGDKPSILACARADQITASGLKIESELYFCMTDPTELKSQIKRMLVEDLMLQITAEDIGDAQPLFGPGGIGLDSVDALQLVVALEKHFGLKIADPEVARGVLQNVNSIVSAVQAKPNV
jgi:acyl carrier protein